MLGSVGGIKGRPRGGPGSRAGLLGLVFPPTWPCFALCLLAIVLLQNSIWARGGGGLVDCQGQLEAARQTLLRRSEEVAALKAAQAERLATEAAARGSRDAGTWDSAAAAPQPADEGSQQRRVEGWGDGHPAAAAGAADVGAAAAAPQDPPAAAPAAAAPAPVVPVAPGVEPAPADPRDARALLVICYNRPDYLRRTLSGVLARLPSYNRPHVYVSQDGALEPVTAVINEFRDQFAKQAPDIPFTHLQHAQDPRNGAKQWGGYIALAQHFGWALGQVFGTAFATGAGQGGGAPPPPPGRGGHPRVIILEDDLEIAPDFFDYFSALEPLLDADASLLAASAYADVGQAGFVDPREARRVHRSDFFPGLGWMLGKHAWEELGPRWPDGFWDDWLREPAQRRGRGFLRPEVSRTVTFGQSGVSQAQFFAQYLGNVRLAEGPGGAGSAGGNSAYWAGADLRYLGAREYDGALAAALSAAREVGYGELVGTSCTPPAGPQGGDSGSAEVEPFGGGYQAVRAAYRGFDGPGGYSELARSFGFIDDVKAGVPRGAYHGVTTIIHNGCRKFLVDADKAAAAMRG